MLSKLGGSDTNTVHLHDRSVTKQTPPTPSDIGQRLTLGERKDWG